MNDTPQTKGRTLDVTGPPESAIIVLESLVALLRGKVGTVGMPPTFSSREELAEAVRQWAESHPKRDTFADWSRDDIYAGRGQ